METITGSTKGLTARLRRKTAIRENL